MRISNLQKSSSKSGNSVLNSAKYSSRNTDEWYTTYETISEEISHYVDCFAGKVVLCNCDDPYESSFCYYFLKHFNQLGLKKLICTSYVGSKISLIHCEQSFDIQENQLIADGEHGFVLIVSKIKGNSNEEVADDEIRRILEKKGTIKQLKGTGDFRSDECISYLKECDICCTNPPFSLLVNCFRSL